MIQQVTDQQAADYLEGATIHKAEDTGVAMVYHGTNKAGVQFALFNSAVGGSAVVEMK